MPSIIPTNGGKGAAVAVLERIYIDNFRCFSNFEFCPERMNLLFGRNGSGKTSLFDTLDGIIDNVIRGEALTSWCRPDDRTRWDSRTEQRFELDLSVDGIRYSYRLRVDHDPEASRSTIQEEVVTGDDKTLFAYRDGTVHLHRNDGSEGTHFPFRSNRSFLPQMEARPENRDLMRVLDHLRRIRSLKLIPSVIEESTSDEDPHLANDGYNFASWYRHLSQEHPAALHELFENLRQVMPDFRSLSLVGAGKQGRTRDLIADFEVPGGGEYGIEFSRLSDGQRVLGVLYTLLVDLKARPGLLLLDEPENFVSLPEIQPWLHQLDDALGDTGQLLMISHHPEVIDTLAANHSVHFVRDGGGPVRIRTGMFDRDGGLRASEQVARGLVDDD